MTHTDRTTHTAPSPFVFRAAGPSDGAAVWRLVQATGALEPNSPYCYLLLVTDFGDTCLIAEQAGEVVGVVLGYHPPREPETAFVWQIGVMPVLRGRGLGLRMLQAWMALPANAHCAWVTATVAEDNPASQALFDRLAATHQTRCEVLPHFHAHQFPHEHPAEPLYRIGPLARGVPTHV